VKLTFEAYQIAKHYTGVSVSEDALLRKLMDGVCLLCKPTTPAMRSVGFVTYCMTLANLNREIDLVSRLNMIFSADRIKALKAELSKIGLETQGRATELPYFTAHGSLWTTWGKPSKDDPRRGDIATIKTSRGTMAGFFQDYEKEKVVLFGLYSNKVGRRAFDKTKLIDIRGSKK
jgi:hypothetical protein